MTPDPNEDADSETTARLQTTEHPDLASDCHTIAQEEAALNDFLRPSTFVRLLLAADHLRAGRCFVDDPPKDPP